MPKASARPIDSNSCGAGFSSEFFEYAWQECRRTAAMSRQSRSLCSILLLLTCFTPVSFGAENPVPECTKDDVRRILLAQDWTIVNVIAVINGLNREKVASPSLCHALAFASRDGRPQDLKLDLYFDRDLGWFTYESSAQLFRVWTRDGYREIKPDFGW